MSVVIVNQDWETADSPYTLTGSGISRSTSSPLNGSYSLLNDLSGAGGSGGTARYDLSNADKAWWAQGSARGQAMQGKMTFKISTAPDGGGQITVLEGPGNAGIYVPSGGTTLRVTDGTSTVNGATSLGTASSHEIQWDARAERNTAGLWFRVWLDGALEIDFRKDTVASNFGWGSIIHGGVGGGKIHGIARWDDILITMTKDAQ